MRASALGGGARQRGDQQGDGGGAEDEGVVAVALRMTEERTGEAAAFGLHELVKDSFGHVRGTLERGAEQKMLRETNNIIIYILLCGSRVWCGEWRLRCCLDMDGHLLL